MPLKIWCEFLSTNSIKYVVIGVNSSNFFQGYIFGIVTLPKMLRFLSRRKVDPVFISIIDNRGVPETDRQAAFAFLKSFGLRLAKSDPPVSNILPNMFDLHDYETVYLSRQQYKKRGFQAVVSANIMGLSSLHILDKFVIDHPVFGTIQTRSTVKFFRQIAFNCFQDSEINTPRCRWPRAVTFVTSSRCPRPSPSGQFSTSETSPEDIKWNWRAPTNPIKIRLVRECSGISKKSSIATRAIWETRPINTWTRLPARGRTISDQST